MLQLFIIIFLLVKLGAGAGWWILFVIIAAAETALWIVTRMLEG